MKKILTMVLAVAGLFLATSTQAQNKDFNRPDSYPSKEYRSNGNPQFGRDSKFKHKKDMDRKRKQFRHGKKHHRHHHHARFQKQNGRFQ